MASCTGNSLWMRLSRRRCFWPSCSVSGSLWKPGGCAFYCTDKPRITCCTWTTLRHTRQTLWLLVSKGWTGGNSNTLLTPQTCLLRIFSLLEKDPAQMPVWLTWHPNNGNWQRTWPYPTGVVEEMFHSVVCPVSEMHHECGKAITLRAWETHLREVKVLTVLCLSTS